MVVAIIVFTFLSGVLMGWVCGHIHGSSNVLNSAFWFIVYGNVIKQPIIDLGIKIVSGEMSALDKKNLESLKQTLTPPELSYIKEKEQEYLFILINGEQ